MNDAKEGYQTYVVGPVKQRWNLGGLYRWEDDPSCYLLLQLSVFGEAGWQALLVLPYLSILIELSYVGYDQ
jgi:hypothetical protein